MHIYIYIFVFAYTDMSSILSVPHTHRHTRVCISLDIHRHIVTYPDNEALLCIQRLSKEEVAFGALAEEPRCDKWGTVLSKVMTQKTVIL